MNSSYLGSFLECFEVPALDPQLSRTACTKLAAINLYKLLTCLLQAISKINIVLLEGITYTFHIQVQI